MSDDNWGKCPHGRIGLCYACNPEPFEDATELRSKLSAAEKEIENLKSSGIHTCHDNCQNRVCILRKENESLKAKLALAATALEELCTGLYYTSRSSCIHICERTLKAINGVREGLV